MKLRTNDNGVDRDMTADEQAAHEAFVLTANAELETQAKTAVNTAAARASGLAKLTALGLTDAEVAALIGG